jgi:tRNA (guanine-N7-)-methyltransferase
LSELESAEPPAQANVEPNPRAAEQPEQAASHIRTYVIRSGRLTEAQKRAIEKFGDVFIIPFSHTKLDFRTCFPEEKPAIVEIGFGMGSATWQIAATRPNFNYLGIEVHTPGVGKLLMAIAENKLRNLRIIQQDAVEVLSEMIPKNSLAGFHIFYPDPWPKTRHHKRRLMRHPLVELMIEKLAPGGYLYFVTDIEDYAASTLELLSSCAGIENKFMDYAHGIDWRPETKFEAKAKKALRPAYELFFVKTEN